MKRLGLLCALVIAACGGSPPEPAKPAPPPAVQPAPHSIAELVPMCKRIFARKATCADDYLPVLLDLRVELNRPPGIGDQVNSQGRDAVLAQAHTELARDTAPDKVAALCEDAAAKATNAPPERVNGLLEQGGRCEATADCKAFADCVVVIDRGFIAGGR